MCSLLPNYGKRKAPLGLCQRRTGNIDLRHSQDLEMSFFYLPYLSFIYDKANCIAILWTGSPHSLGSCHFRGVWATCLPHEGGGVSLSVFPKDTTRNFPACSPQPPLNAERQVGKLRMPFFKAFWYDSTRGLNPRSTDCEADPLTTTPIDILLSIGKGAQKVVNILCAENT